jgi:hypothetical protein
MLTLNVGILNVGKTEIQSTMFCYRNLAECPPVFQAICSSYTDKSVENLKSTSAKQMSVSRSDEDKTVIAVTAAH